MPERTAVTVAVMANLVAAVFLVGCGSETHNVTQPSCTYVLSPVSLSMSAGGGTASVTVATASGCAWTVVINDASWLTIAGNNSGVGSGTVTVVASANTSVTSRTAMVTVVNQSVTVSQSPSPSGGSSSVMSGTALEFTATGTRRPVPNLRLKVWAASKSDGAVGGVELPDVVTDGNGRYEIAGITNPILFVKTAPGSDYRFLCDFYPLEPVIALRSPIPALHDLPLVHVSWAGTTLPPGMWSPSTSVHGTVSERINGRLEPIAGATVTLDTGLQDPPATTSASGFYQICSVVGTDQYRTITARKDGYSPTTREIFGGWDFRIDLELALVMSRSGR
jgi:hypothetical protein